MIECILKKLIKYNIIDASEKKVFKYGLFVILFNLLLVVSFLLMGLILDKSLDTILFLIFFIPIRITLGGYHCKTPLNCFLMSNFFMFIVMLLVSHINVSLIDSTILFIIAISIQKNKTLFFKYVLCISVFFYILGIINFQLRSYITMSFFTNMILYYLPVVYDRW